MIFKDITFISPEENLLFDDVLLDLAEQDRGGEALRFWESPRTFIVLGRICREAEDLRLEEVHKDGIPVLRRSSGGGTVVQGPGCLNYTLILSKGKNPWILDLRQSYIFILGRIVEALRASGIDAQFQPISDLALALNQKKFSGNSQKRGRKFILHHGTVLYNFDLSRVERYLKMPRSVPEYRRGRPHLEFLTNLPLTQEKIKKCLVRAFPVEKKETSLSEEEEKGLEQFESKTAVDLLVRCRYNK